MSCVCCFENVVCFRCECGILYCKTCLSYAVNVAIEEFRVLNCFGSCGKTVPEIAINSSVPQVVFDHYQEVVVSIEMAKLGVKSRKVCDECKMEPHKGPCVLSEEEKANNDFLLHCCGVKFYRGDACNKVKCPICKTAFCWVCKKEILSYKHFEMKRCELYGEREAIIEKIVNEQARLFQVTLNAWAKIETFFQLLETGNFNVGVLVELKNDMIQLQPTITDNMFSFLVRGFSDFLSSKSEELSTNFMLENIESCSISSMVSYYNKYQKFKRQCSGIKKDGLQCSYNTAGVYCKIHLK